MTYRQLAESIQLLLPTDRPYILLAESFAGPLAILLASRKAPLLKGVVLVATFARSPYPKIMGFVFRSVSPLLPAFAPAWIIRFFLLNGRQPSLAPSIQHAIKGLNKSVLTHRVLSAIHCDVGTELASLDVPVMAIGAASDRIMPAQALRQIKHGNASVQTLLLDAPHFVLQTEPSAAWRSIRPFIENACRK